MPQPATTVIINGALHAYHEGLGTFIPVASSATPAPSATPATQTKPPKPPQPPQTLTIADAIRTVAYEGRIDRDKAIDKVMKLIPSCNREQVLQGSRQFQSRGELLIYPAHTSAAQDWTPTTKMKPPRAQSVVEVHTPVARVKKRTRLKDYLLSVCTDTPQSLLTALELFNEDQELGGRDKVNKAHAYAVKGVYVDREAVTFRRAREGEETEGDKRRINL